MTTVQSQPRRVVAEYQDYADAQRAVDRLSDAGFPVERVAIIGEGLRWVEQIGGRLTTGRAALMGAAQGALLGGLLSALVTIFFTIDPNPAVLLVIVYGIVAGGILGALLGALLHAMTGGERDFVSRAGMTAQRYEIVVEDDYADRAIELLRSFDAPPAAGADGIPTSANGSRTGDTRATGPSTAG